MNLPQFALLALPYARLELPGWGKLLKKVGVFRTDNELWGRASTGTIRGKWHGYLMRLDLSNWSERQTYFLGRFYDLETQLFIKAAVKPGDSFIDVGANIGMITLLAARCVEPIGRVHAFEPNPMAFERLHAAVADNELVQVTLHPCGLSDLPAELTLSVVTEHTGMGTLAQITQKDQPLISKQYQVPVYRGDDVLPNDLPGVAFIKIDVEGFEPRVIRGLSSTLRRLRPVVLTEVVAGHLERAGSSVEELCAVMHDYGYEAFNLETKRSAWRHRLRLSRASHHRMTDNVAWLHPDSISSSRLEPWIIP